uniref:Uncharacterized protein n=1 Tax=Cajanus cajan TaxID=3821 RepID=A0A151SGS8_CAJCA|nr:hypothetical protein KK1_000144 [Cajanus cajan]
MDIGNVYYMFMFNVMGNKEKVIGGNASMIFDHYLTMMSLTLDFMASKIKSYCTLT